MKVDVWALLILVKVARLGLSSDAGIIEGGDEEVANEIVSEDGSAAFEDRAGEEVVDVVFERLFADAERREWSGGSEREAKHGGEAEGSAVDGELRACGNGTEPVGC